jgi:hypothetical protein
MLPPKLNFSSQYTLVETSCSICCHKYTLQFLHAVGDTAHELDEGLRGKYNELLLVKPFLISPSSFSHLLQFLYTNFIAL